jgi:hypothetical protein
LGGEAGDDRVGAGGGGGGGGFEGGEAATQTMTGMVG